MSRTSDRKAMAETLAGYPLMTVRELAAFLRCSDDHAVGLCRDGAVRSVNIARTLKRAEFRIDPVDAAVYLLALQQGMTQPEFWEVHGPEGTVDVCMRLVRRIRKIQAAA